MNRRRFLFLGAFILPVLCLRSNRYNNETHKTTSDDGQITITLPPASSYVNITASKNQWIITSTERDSV